MISFIRVGLPIFKVKVSSICWLSLYTETESLMEAWKYPLLNKNLNNTEILKNILRDRQKYYEKADLIINNDGDKFQSLKEIKSQLNKYAN